MFENNNKEITLFTVFFIIFIIISCCVYQNSILSQNELKIISFVQKHLAYIPLKIPVFITDLAYGTIRDYIILFVIIIFLFAKKYKDLLIFFFALPATQYLYSFFKIVIARPRPPVEMRLIEVKNDSFPSGHSIMSLILYGLLIYFVCKYIKNKLLKTIFISVLTITVFFVGFSRIWLGVHFPTDVLGGFSLGICCLCICVIIDKTDFKSLFSKIKNKNDRNKIAIQD